jgi:hypothetical protein
MNRLACLGLMLALGVGVANACDVPRTIDLRDQRALEALEASNPAHFESIQRILAAVLDSPEQVTETWLRANFNASQFSLQRGILKTSYPPKQLLQFTLDDVRYKMYLVRSDMTPGFTPAVIRP